METAAARRAYIAANAAEVDAVFARLFLGRARRSRLDPDDLRQEFWEIILRRQEMASAFRPEAGTLAAYVYVVGRTVFSNALAKRKRRARIETPGNTTDAAASHTAGIAPEVLTLSETWITVADVLTELGLPGRLIARCSAQARAEWSAETGIEPLIINGRAAYPPQFRPTLARICKRENSALKQRDRQPGQLGLF